MSTIFRYTQPRSLCCHGLEIVLVSSGSVEMRRIIQKMNTHHVVIFEKLFRRKLIWNRREYIGNLFAGAGKVMLWIIC